MRPFARPSRPRSLLMAKSSSVELDRNALDPNGDSTPVAFRWTPTTGTTSLGFAGSPEDITPDGATIVGSRPATDPFSEAFRWNEQDGLQGLGFLSTGEWKSSHAQFVSNDGNVVVGFSFPENLHRWAESLSLDQVRRNAASSAPWRTRSPPSESPPTRTSCWEICSTSPAEGSVPTFPFSGLATGGLRPLSELLALHGTQQRVSAVGNQQVSLDQFNFRRRPHHLRNFDALRRRRNPVGSNPNLLLRALAPRAVTRSQSRHHACWPPSDWRRSCYVAADKIIPLSSVARDSRQKYGRVGFPVCPHRVRGCLRYWMLLKIGLLSIPATRVEPQFSGSGLLLFAAGERNRAGEGKVVGALRVADMLP